MKLGFLEKKIAEAKTLIKIGDFSNKLSSKVISSESDSIKELIENSKFPDNVKEQIIYYKALSLVAEVLIYENKLEKLKEFLSSYGTGILFSLNQIESDSIKIKNNCGLDSIQARQLDDFEKEIVELIKAKILLAIHCLDADPYREGKYLMVEDSISKCVKIIENIHHETYSPCFGTLSSLNYAYGCVLRQLYKYKLAEYAFGKAIDYAHQRLQTKLSTNKPATEKQLASYRVARVLSLGFGFILMKQGYLRRAESCVATSRILFEQANDPVYSTFAKLIHACILRSRSGYKIKELDGVIKILENCIEEFRNLSHIKYQSRAEYELGVCLVQYLEALTKSPYGVKSEKIQSEELKKISKAETLLRKVYTNASEPLNKRWVANSKIALSNLCRVQGAFKQIEINHSPFKDKKVKQQEVKCYSDALNFAEDAIDAVREPEQRSCLISGYVAKGEVLIKLSRLDEARVCFELALAKSNENPRKMAICHLAIALISSSQGIYSQAKEHLGKGKNLIKEIEDPVIKNRASEVEQEITNMERILIINPDETLDYEFHEKRLKEFLLKRAQERGKNLTELSEILGISRPTLHKWMAPKSSFASKKINK